MVAQKRGIAKAPVAISAFTGAQRDDAPAGDEVRATAPGARLRAAAAAGRTKEVSALLAHGVAVDDADFAGETALMKSIRADRRGVAALLVRHGASLDRQDLAGESARDMARAKGDAALNRALGL